MTLSDLTESQRASVDAIATTLASYGYERVSVAIEPYPMGPEHADQCLVIEGHEKLTKVRWRCTCWFGKAPASLDVAIESLAVAVRGRRPRRQLPEGEP